MFRGGDAQSSFQPLLDSTIDFSSSEDLDGSLLLANEFSHKLRRNTIYAFVEGSGELLIGDFDLDSRRLIWHHTDRADGIIDGTCITVHNKNVYLLGGRNARGNNVLYLIKTQTPTNLINYRWLGGIRPQIQHKVRSLDPLSLGQRWSTRSRLCNWKRSFDRRCYSMDGWGLQIKGVKKFSFFFFQIVFPPESKTFSFLF